MRNYINYFDWKSYSEVLSFVGILHYILHIFLFLKWFDLLLSVNISCEVWGNPKPDLDWIKTSQHLNFQTSTLQVIQYKYSSHKYTIKMVKISHGGIYIYISTAKSKSDD